MYNKGRKYTCTPNTCLEQNFGGASSGSRLELWCPGSGRDGGTWAQELCFIERKDHFLSPQTSFVKSTDLTSGRKGGPRSTGRASDSRRNNIEHRVLHFPFLPVHPQTSAQGSNQRGLVPVLSWLADEGEAAVSPGACVQGEDGLLQSQAWAAGRGPRQQPGGAQGGRWQAQPPDTDTTQGPWYHHTREGLRLLNMNLIISVTQKTRKCEDIQVTFLPTNTRVPKRKGKDRGQTLGVSLNS